MEPLNSITLGPVSLLAQPLQVIGVVTSTSVRFIAEFASGGNVRLEVRSSGGVIVPIEQQVLANRPAAF